MNYKYVKIIVLLLLSFMFFILGWVVLFYVFTPLPDVDIENIVSKQSIVLEDRNGKFLFDFSDNEKRTYIPISEISPNIINATIAIEDHLFFEHSGIRIDAFIRALINNIKTLSFSQGGSTITQQVIKNVFLTTEKKIERKMKEFLLASKLEERLSKEKILEIYLNTIPYGGIVYGIGEASNTFFGKKPSELTLSEAAYLASIPNAPTYLSPHGSHKKALEDRKNHVLELMLELEIITRQEYIKAREEVAHFEEQSRFSGQASHFVFFVKEMLEKEYGIRLKQLEGRKTRTTLDLDLQKDIESRAKAFSLDLEERFKAKNIASIVLSVKTGEILAMIGSRDFFNSEIDGAVNITTSLRQTGSTFKPIAYAKAFEKGFRPETIVYDVPTQFSGLCEKDFFESTSAGCYSPVNYTGNSIGPVTLRNALAQSINIPAVKVLYLANIDDVIALAKKMGITSLDKDSQHYGLSLVLGGAEVTPLEVAQAYNVFANEGSFVPYKWKLGGDVKPRRVLKKEIAKDITSILSDSDARAPVFGRNSAINITSPQVAVKTGTTNNSRDIWIVGYSQDLVVLVWAGNSDGAVLENEASGFYLAPLFRDIFHIATRKYGNFNTYFRENNTSPSTLGPEILSGIIDSKDQHSILHYVQREKPTQKPSGFKNEPQYENWEFAVENWIKENKYTGDDLFDKNVQKEKAESFSITSPTEGKVLNKERVITIIATPIQLENTRYEFYINNKLIGSSHVPLFSFVPNNTIGVGDEGIVIQVIANTSIGVFTTENVYEFK